MQQERRKTSLKKLEDESGNHTGTREGRGVVVRLRRIEEENASRRGQAPGQALIRLCIKQSHNQNKTTLTTVEDEPSLK